MDLAAVAQIKDFKKKNSLRIWRSFNHLFPNLRQTCLKSADIDEMFCTFWTNLCKVAAGNGLDEQLIFKEILETFNLRYHMPKNNFQCEMRHKRGNQMWSLFPFVG